MKTTKEDLADAVIELVNSQKELKECSSSRWTNEKIMYKNRFDTAVINYNSILEERIKEIINEKN